MSFELILPFLRPIESLLLDESISEIMGNPDASWWYERDGIVCRESSVSFDAGRLRTGLEVIANQLGKKLDEDNPLLHAQLPDGSRLAAVIPPVVRPAPALTIRKFPSRHYTVDDLIARGTLTRPLADLLAAQIRSGKTLLISGGTSTGKTTVLRALASAIPDEQRIVVIEDTSELHLQKPNLLSVECQTDTFKASITFDDLLKSALRWRPDRIILGEVRGIEARTLLDSLNTGHTGSLATIHVWSAKSFDWRTTTAAPSSTNSRRFTVPIQSSIHNRISPERTHPMPLLEIIQTRQVTASIRLDEPTAALIDQYAAFLHASADEVVDKALCYVFAKDRDFQDFLRTPAAAHAPESLRIRRMPQNGTSAEPPNAASKPSNPMETGNGSSPRS
jgi:pilus assembly protein CpaF